MESISPHQFDISPLKFGVQLKSPSKHDKLESVGKTSRIVIAIVVLVYAGLLAYSYSRDCLLQLILLVLLGFGFSRPYFQLIQASIASKRPCLYTLFLLSPLLPLFLNVITDSSKSLSLPVFSGLSISFITTTLLAFSTIKLLTQEGFKQHETYLYLNGYILPIVLLAVPLLLSSDLIQNRASLGGASGNNAVLFLFASLSLLRFQNFFLLPTKK